MAAIKPGNLLGSLILTALMVLLTPVSPAHHLAMFTTLAVLASVSPPDGHARRFIGTHGPLSTADANPNAGYGRAKTNAAEPNTAASNICPNSEKQRVSPFYSGPQE